MRPGKRSHGNCCSEECKHKGQRGFGRSGVAHLPPHDRGNRWDVWSVPVSASSRRFAHGSCSPSTVERAGDKGKSCRHQVFLCFSIYSLSAQSDLQASLVEMGFPQKRPLDKGAFFSGRGGEYVCPRCASRVEVNPTHPKFVENIKINNPVTFLQELPAQCSVCSLTLVSSPHLARSYHHLFPVAPFEVRERKVYCRFRPGLNRSSRDYAGAK